LYTPTCISLLLFFFFNV